MYALLGDDRGEVAAATVAADAHQRGVGAQILCVLDRPRKGSDRVLSCDGRLGLGGPAVVDRQDPDPRLLRQIAAIGVVAVQVADHPAATVEEHQQPAPGCRSGARHVEASTQLAIRAADSEFGHP